MKTHKFLILMVVFWLSACVGRNTKTEQAPAKQVSTPNLVETSSKPDNSVEHSATPVSRTSEFSADATDGKIPVAISWFQENDQGLSLASSLLGSDIEYPTLAIEDTKTVFLGPTAIDSQNNLYIIYGYKNNYISKLSPEGAITTKELPFDRSSQALWLGEKMVVVPAQSTKSTYIIDTSLNITEITPSLNANTDGVSNNIGFLGIADVSNNLAIWVFSHPLRNDSGSFAHYRTLDLSSGETFDGMLPIPVYEESYANSTDPLARFGTQIYGVDPFQQNVLLCYGKSAGDNQVISILELYSSQFEKTINQQERCCMNNVFELRGDTFIENHSPESCSAHTIQNWSDMATVIDVQQFLPMEKPGNSWIVSNGRVWVIKSNRSLAVFNADKLLETEYNLPDDLPVNVQNADTFQIGLMMIPD